MEVKRVFIVLSVVICPFTGSQNLHSPFYRCHWDKSAQCGRSRRRTSTWYWCCGPASGRWATACWRSRRCVGWIRPSRLSRSARCCRWPRPLPSLSSTSSCHKHKTVMAERTSAALAGWHHSQQTKDGALHRIKKSFKPAGQHVEAKTANSRWFGGIWNVICSTICHDLFRIKRAQGICCVWGLLTEPCCSQFLIKDGASTKGGWNRMRYGGEWSLPLSYSHFDDLMYYSTSPTVT